MASLLIGCGNSRVKKLSFLGKEAWTGNLVTLDMDPNCGADYVIDMGKQHDGKRFVMPFDSDSFDEMGAYDSLEHWGQQGDWRAWFDEMSEYHRILKPGGTFGVLVPIGPDAYADPGHTRFFSVNHFFMLGQQWYVDSIEAGRAVTDYRFYWRKDFKIQYMAVEGDHHIAVMLEKA